jgi:hypothetical protein
MYFDHSDWREAQTLTDKYKYHIRPNLKGSINEVTFLHYDQVISKWVIHGVYTGDRRLYYEDLVRDEDNCLNPDYPEGMVVGAQIETDGPGRNVYYTIPKYYERLPNDYIIPFNRKPWLLYTQPIPPPPHPRRTSKQRAKLRQKYALH